MYTVLESAVTLLVKFHMNPVSNYTVYWSKEDLTPQDINIRDVTDGEYIQTTYFIRKVTTKHLGNYTVQVINWAIESEHKEATFNVILKLKGEKGKFMSISSDTCSK